MNAQPRNGRGMGPGKGLNQDTPCRAGIENVLTDLTDDQKTALEELRVAHFKEMQEYRNEMMVINAKQRAIRSAYEIDEKAAAKLIDEKTALMNKQMKARIAHKAAVNEILTEEQVLELQQRYHKRQFAGMRQGNGCTGYGCEGRQFGPRHGRGPGRGI